MALNIEGIVNCTVHAEKPLRGAALPSISEDGPYAARASALACRPRRCGCAKRASLLDGRRPVWTTLDQDLKDLAFVVDSTPQIHVLACDPDDHFRRDASDRSVENGTAAGMTEATRDTVVFDLGGSHGTG